MIPKIDMTLERSKEQWQVLLDCVKTNDNNVLNTIEQQWYIEQIEFKLGIRNKNIEVLKMIEEQSPDYSDIV